VDRLHIAVDPRLELLMAVQSSVSDYSKHGPLAHTSFPYLDEAFDLARRHERDPAVALWRALCADGFTFDAPVTFALWHSPPPEFEPSAEYSPYLVRRAKGAERLHRFAAALRGFAVTADFRGFLGRWRPQFGDFEAQARSVITADWPAQLDAYAGRPKTEFRVLLAPLSGGSYGTGVGGVAHSVVAPSWTTAGPRFDDLGHMRYLVLHEGAHDFVNEAIFGVARELEASARLLEPIAARMADQAYPRWITAICEHVVRAVVARLADDPEPVLAEEEGRGFIHIRPVFTALAEYEARRSQYPDFRAFGPRLAEVFLRLAEEAGVQ